MKLNREVLIAAVMRHQGVFFRMLDYIDQHDGSLDIPEHLYLNDYNRIICRDDDSNMQHHLNIQTLLDNGIFIHHDRGAGVITLERVIVDLLRFLDVKRAKELTNADFEQMRVQLVGAVEHVMAQVIDSQPYLDAMSTFNNLMSEIHSKVKENVHALMAQVDNLAMEYKQYDAGLGEVSAFDLYSKVTSLYERFVLPCYEFINPSMEMVQTQSFSTSVQTLIDHHALGQTKRFEVATKAQLRKTVISSYYKDIALLSKKLEQFSSHLKQERSHFLALESAYSELLISIEPLRHGRRKNKYLSSDSKVFSHHHSLDGLTSQKSKFTKKISWDSDNTKLQFKEYLNLIQQQSIKKKSAGLKPLLASDMLDQDRQISISNVLYQTPVPANTPDVHQFIFDLLKRSLNDFKLVDVLYGIEDVFSTYEGIERTNPAICQQMDDGKHFINYLPVEYKKDQNHV